MENKVTKEVTSLVSLMNIPKDVDSVDIGNTHREDFNKLSSIPNSPISEHGMTQF
jgi:hypothetical protein